MIALLLGLALAQDPGRAVVIASRELPPGVELTPSDIALFTLPSDLMPETLYGTVVFEDPAMLVGRVTRERVLKGDVIREERLAERGLPAGVEGMLPDGWVLAEIGLEEPTRLLQPARFVDLYWRYDTGACALLQAVWVVGVRTATGDRSTLPGGIAHGLIFAVTPTQAGAIDDATATGVVVPVLRNDVDLAPVDLPPCQAPPPPAPVAPTKKR